MDNHHYLLWVLVVSIVSICPLQAQTESEEELIESLSEEQSAELLQELQDLRRNPIDINRAGIDELGKIPFITQVFMHAIIRQREERGLFRSLIDFRKRLQIEDGLWKKIKPYLEIKSTKFKNISFTYRSRFQRYFSGQENHGDEYPGSAWKIYQRIRMNQEDVFNSVLLSEKDAGEKNPADHLVGFIEINNVYKNIRLLLGNYYLKLGQGLIAWSPYGFSKGVYPVSSVKKSSMDLKGYKSSDENNFLTGMAVDLQMKAFRIFLFGSGTKLDASFNHDGTIKSFPTSGYHRTVYERESKEQVRENLRGIRIQINTHKGRIGVNYLSSRYSHPVKRDLGDKNLFSFRGSQYFLTSLDFDFCFDRFNVFGEIAKGGSPNTAFLTGCVYDFDLIKGVLIYRNFPPRFYSPHGQGFGSSSVKNESGINIGFSAKIFKIKFNLMFDLYNKPWRTYTTPVPARGHDLYLWISRKISSNFKIKYKFKFRSKEDFETYTSKGNPKEILKTQQQMDTRLEFLWNFRSVKFKTRIEWNHVYDTDIEQKWSYQEMDETGILFFQDIDLDCFHPLSLRMRWIQFKTDSYLSRVYEFENDLPGAFSIPFLYGEGYRWYVIARMNIIDHFDITLKYRETDILRPAGSSAKAGNRERKRYLGIQADVVF